MDGQINYQKIRCFHGNKESQPINTKLAIELERLLRNDYRAAASTNYDGALDSVEKVKQLKLKYRVLSSLTSSENAKNIPMI